MLTRYEVCFRHEILNEFAGHISGFVTRNYIYTETPIPKEIEEQEREAVLMERTFTPQDDEEKLDSCLKRMQEIKQYIWSRTPVPHR